MTGWQPIETAPRDGRWVLVCGGTPADDFSEKRPAVAQWTDDLNGRKTEWHWQFAWYDGGYYGVYESPTHWQPLPPPPEPQQ